jgi:LuxR family transcriptional regulator, regulator of acetate metabolism
MTLHAVARRVAVQEDAASILQAAVDGARELLGTDAAFAAVARHELNVFEIAVSRGLTTGAFRDIVIPPMAGLGGRVGALRRPMAVYDYLTDEGISRDFVDVVHQEGLRGMACVPVPTSLGIDALLYVATRSPGYLGDGALDTFAAVGMFAGAAIDQARVNERQREITVLRERQRLATALHSSVAQSLFAIGVEAKQRHEHDDPQRLADALDSIATLASRAGAELRSTLHRINDVPSAMTLALALDADARAFEQAEDVTIRVVTVGESRPLLASHEALICDTVHEGIRNAVKHARAQLVVVHLRYGEHEIGLTVQSDRASTAKPSAALGADGGLGLLRGRAEALRGGLEFVLGEEGEAILRLRLPYYCGDALSAA